MHIQSNLNDPTGKAEILLQTGIILRIQGRYASSLAAMEEALILVPDNKGGQAEKDAAILRGATVADGESIVNRIVS